MAIEKTVDRVTRLLAMMSYLGERDEVPIAELARHFGVSEVQARRDIDLLWVTGVPGYYHGDLVDFYLDDEAAVVSLTEGQGLSRRVPFAPREALALAAAVEWMRALGTADGETAEAIESVRTKLRGLLPADVTDVTPPDPAVRDVILATIESRGALWLRYVSASDEVTERVVVPRGLTTDGAHWYLDAWCTRARAGRTFRLDRILAMEPAEAGITPPSEGSEVLEQVTVTLVLRPRARWFAEELPGAQIREIGGDEPLLEVSLEIAPGGDWLVRRLVGLGGDVVTVEPGALRERVRARAREALGAYGDG